MMHKTFTYGTTPVDVIRAALPDSYRIDAVKPDLVTIVIALRLASRGNEDAERMRARIIDDVVGCDPEETEDYPWKTALHLTRDEMIVLVGALRDTDWSQVEVGENDDWMSLYEDPMTLYSDILTTLDIEEV